MNYDFATQGSHKQHLINNVENSKAFDSTMWLRTF